MSDRLASGTPVCLTAPVQYDRKTTLPIGLQCKVDYKRRFAGDEYVLSHVDADGREFVFRSKPSAFEVLNLSEEFQGSEEAVVG